jgi:hypothetical protein
MNLAVQSLGIDFYDPGFEALIELLLRQSLPDTSGLHSTGATPVLLSPVKTIINNY